MSDHTRHIHTCLQCGASFHRYESQCKNGWGMYCSRRCQANARMDATVAISTGTRIGHLTVSGTHIRKPDGPDGELALFVPCICDCGNEIIVRRAHLLKGKPKSCGCATKDALRAAALKHGQFGTRLYSIWHTMRSRCGNPNDQAYAYYGGRGITVCDEWQDFPTFHAWAMSHEYADDLTIDRINNDLGYCPENARFVSQTIQARNRPDNVLLKIWGETKCVAEWAEDSRCIVKEDTLRTRLRQGWDPKDALTTAPIAHVDRSRMRFNQRHKRSE